MLSIKCKEKSSIQSEFIGTYGENKLEVSRQTSFD